MNEERPKIYCLGEQDYPLIARNFRALKTVGDLIRGEKIRSIFLPDEPEDKPERVNYKLVEDYCFHNPHLLVCPMHYPARDFEELFSRTQGILRAINLKPSAVIVPVKNVLEVSERYNKLDFESEVLIF